MSTERTDPLEALRRLCLQLPEATERLSHGEPTWFAGGKRTFVTFADHHHDDRLAFWCAAPPGAQETLVAANPERFFVPPYVGHRGWIGVRIDGRPSWKMVETLVEQAHRCVAPAKLLRTLSPPGRG
jgi:hypothetical protein